MSKNQKQKRNVDVRQLRYQEIYELIFLIFPLKIKIILAAKWEGGRGF